MDVYMDNDVAGHSFNAVDVMSNSAYKLAKEGAEVVAESVRGSLMAAKQQREEAARIMSVIERQHIKKQISSANKKNAVEAQKRIRMEYDRIPGFAGKSRIPVGTGIALMPGKLVHELRETVAVTPTEVAEDTASNEIASNGTQVVDATDVEAKLIDPEYNYVLKVDNVMCCKFNNCSDEYEVDCSSWFSNGIDPGEEEARKEADQRHEAALSHIELVHKADVNRGNMTGAEETALFVAHENKREDELMAETKMNGTNGNAAWWDLPQYKPTSKAYKASAPPASELAVRGPNATSTVDERTGEITMAYDDEGYPKPWDTSDMSDYDFPKGTNLDPDPAKYTDPDSPFNETYVAMNLDKFPEAAVKAARKAASEAQSAVMNQELLIRSIPAGTPEREAALKTLEDLKVIAASKLSALSEPQSGNSTTPSASPGAPPSNETNRDTDVYM